MATLGQEPSEPLALKRSGKLHTNRLDRVNLGETAFDDILPWGERSQCFGP
jgi:hypothetical protein